MGQAVPSEGQEEPCADLATELRLRRHPSSTPAALRRKSDRHKPSVSISQTPTPFALANLDLGAL